MPGLIGFRDTSLFFIGCREVRGMSREVHLLYHVSIDDSSFLPSWVKILDHDLHRPDLDKGPAQKATMTAGCLQGLLISFLNSTEEGMQRWDLCVPSLAATVLSFCQQCKFLHFYLFFCVFITKNIDIKWNWRCNFFTLKIRRCKILDKSHIWGNYDIHKSSFPLLFN